MIHPNLVGQHHNSLGITVKSLFEYQDGGLCPIIINDILEGYDLFYKDMHHSFKIVGKLGRGAFSTVWLGKDM